MYYVLCTMYYVLCTMYYVLCTMYYVLCTMYYIQNTLYYNPPLTFICRGSTNTPRQWSFGTNRFLMVVSPVPSQAPGEGERGRENHHQQYRNGRTGAAVQQHEHQSTSTQYPLLSTHYSFPYTHILIYLPTIAKLIFCSCSLNTALSLLAYPLKKSTVLLLWKETRCR
jgi:hypothetical protein